MVCDRCKWVVKSELEKLGHQVLSVNLGEVELKDAVNPGEIDVIDQKLKDFGFELINDKSAALIERIRALVIQLVQHAEQLDKQNLSDYLSKKLHKEYSALSKLFSETMGITIEQYFILQKIERAKELIVYNEMSLTQIAFELGYSSVAHLSSQFKKVTGLTASHFKGLKHPQRTSLDEVSALSLRG